ncbi:hypothetical protein [Sphingomonas aerolata]|uniref:hypothetical protein n=1 Tax=Sphingomonas aerolata TaxID=185951 RepID=UPI003A5BEC73
MEAVDEFEPERDQQREPEERERTDRERLADLRGIGGNAEPRIGQPPSNIARKIQRPAGCRS